MGVSAGWKRAGLLGLCLLLLLSPLTVRAADREARELTGECAVVWSGSEQAQPLALTDGRIDTSCRMQPGDGVRLEAPEDMGTLILRFYMQDVPFLLMELDEQGSALHEQELTAAAMLTLSLTAGCRQVQLQALDGGLRICEAMAFTPGALPEDVPHPAPPLEKVDFLMISTHPDDEWVFLGGVYPIYGGERGYAGTVAYVTLPKWQRVQEAVNGMWIGGSRTLPYFLGFPDVHTSAPQRYKDTFKQEEVTLALVRLYRRLRPLVVVTQDPENGEYGHWQHKLSAQAAFDAVALAADPAYDPESVETYGTWTVMKMYQHFAQGLGTVELDVEAPLMHYGGRTALEVANAAFEAHKTQLRTRYRPGNTANLLWGDIVHFGLTWSTVGTDTEGDFFEHIPEEALTRYVPPTPAPTAEPTHTPAPTAAPAPTGTPASAPTAGPAEVPDTLDRGTAWAAEHAYATAAPIMLLPALAAAGWVVIRRRRPLPPGPSRKTEETTPREDEP